MSYTRERDEFISRAAAEGLSVETCRKLLRYATTLHRLAEAQCNGDWPYNGDRDRPNAVESTCYVCNGTGTFKIAAGMSFKDQSADFVKCDTCHGNGKTWARDTKADERHDSRYTVCPKCDASGVAKSAMRRSKNTFLDAYSTDCQKALIKQGHPKTVKVCPDCRTQELVMATLAGETYKVKTGTMPATGFYPDQFKPIFQGDPRGAVLRLSTPNHPWTEDGRGMGLYVPARDTR